MSRLLPTRQHPLPGLYQPGKNEVADPFGKKLAEELAALVCMASELHELAKTQLGEGRSVGQNASLLKARFHLGTALSELRNARQAASQMEAREAPSGECPTCFDSRRLDTAYKQTAGG